MTVSEPKRCDKYAWCARPYRHNDACSISPDDFTEVSSGEGSACPTCGGTLTYDIKAIGPGPICNNRWHFDKWRAEPIRGAPPSGHTPDCCLDLDHKGDCRRWMKLPPNPTFPKFKELHVQDDWCPKAGCRPASRCEIDAFLGGAEPSRGAPDAARKKACNSLGLYLPGIETSGDSLILLDRYIELRAGHVVLLEALKRLDWDVLRQAADYLNQSGGGPMEDRLRLLAIEAEAAIKQAERT